MDEKLISVYRIASGLWRLSSLETFDRLIDRYVQHPEKVSLTMVERTVRRLARQERRPMMTTH